MSDHLDGWDVYYDPATRFVGANHPDGGRKTICEVYDDATGRQIAKALNTREHDTLCHLTSLLLDGRGCWTKDELVGAVTALRASLAQAVADRERLLACLRPFAECASQMPGVYPANAGCVSSLSVCRAAAALVAEMDAKGGTT